MLAIMSCVQRSNFCPGCMLQVANLRLGRCAWQKMCRCDGLDRTGCMQVMGNSLNGSLTATVPATDQWVQCDRCDARFLSVGHCQEGPSIIASLYCFPVQLRSRQGGKDRFSLCLWWLAESQRSDCDDCFTGVTCGGSSLIRHGSSWRRRSRIAGSAAMPPGI